MEILKLEILLKQLNYFVSYEYILLLGNAIFSPYWLTDVNQFTESMKHLVKKWNDTSNLSLHFRLQAYIWETRLLLSWSKDSSKLTAAMWKCPDCLSVNLSYFSSHIAWEGSEEQRVFIMWKNLTSFRQSCSRSCVQSPVRKSQSNSLLSPPTTAPKRCIIDIYVSYAKRNMEETCVM